MGAEPGQDLPDHSPRGIVAEGAHEFALGPDGGDILRDVRGAAQGMGALPDADDGDGGLGGDPLDVPPQVHVEHRVADNGDPRPGCGREQRFETRARD